MELAESREPAPEDGRGCSAVELLIDDRLEQRIERGVLALEFEGEGPGALDELADFGVCLGELLAGERGIVANGTASIHG
jgi:hypothetical protein